jgi:hypothetical protein
MPAPAVYVIAIIGTVGAAIAFKEVSCNLRWSDLSHGARNRSIPGRNRALATNIEGHWIN